MTRATEQKRIDAMVDQFHKWQRRERGTPVRVWVHAEHGEARVVGTVVHATQRNADRRKAWGRAVTDPGHPWHPVDEVYIQVGEEEVSVKLHDTTWGIATGGDALESPVGSDDEDEVGCVAYPAGGVEVF